MSVLCSTLTDPTSSLLPDEAVPAGLDYQVIDGRCEAEALPNLAEALERALPRAITAAQLLSLPQKEWGRVVAVELQHQHIATTSPVRVILDRTHISWNQARHAIASLKEIEGLRILMLVTPDLEPKAARGLPWLVRRPGLMLALAAVPGLALSLAINLVPGDPFAGGNSPHLKPSPYAGAIYPAVRQAAMTEAVPLPELAQKAGSGR